MVSFREEGVLRDEEAHDERSFVQSGQVHWSSYSTVDVPFPEEYEEEEPRLPLSVMSEAVARLMALAPKTRDVVCWRFAGMRYREIARRMGVTVAAAELRHRRALVQWPALRELFAEKAAKQSRRKTHRRVGGGSSRAEQVVSGLPVVESIGV
jgi:DNA-directed RNA polymerase specialized sigma24 family protein